MIDEEAFQNAIENVKPLSHPSELRYFIQSYESSRPAPAMGEAVSNLMRQIYLVDGEPHIRTGKETLQAIIAVEASLPPQTIDGTTFFAKGD